MQVVFVHGVNTRDLGDGEYPKWVAGRTDRLARLAFAGNAEIRNPYWGQHGLATKALKSLPREKHGAVTFGVEDRFVADGFLRLAKENFAEAIAAASVAAISEATLHASTNDRRELEDFWVTAAAVADASPPPDWLSTIRSDDELISNLAREVNARHNLYLAPVASPLEFGWKPSLPSWDANAFVASKGRDVLAGYLAQFLGDALMFFSRRDQSIMVRNEICASIVDAARVAADKGNPLVLIGYSMGGAILHEILTDPDMVASIEDQIERPLKIDLFLSVGTQIGMFAELKQFATHAGPLAVPVDHYWNVFDYNDTLAFLCTPVVPGVVDMEISTNANVAAAHGVYFESALFYSRLKARLVDIGLVHA